MLKQKQPNWILPMLATLSKNCFSDKDWIYEEKLDGIRCLVIKKNNKVWMYSRTKHLLNATYKELEDIFLKQKQENFILDGEIVAFTNGVSSFSKLQQVKRKKIEVFYYVFDILYLDKFDLRNRSILERKEYLFKNFQFNKHFCFTKHIVREGEKYFKEACKKGWEGIIGKNKWSKYVSKRSKEWLKFKCIKEQELIIIGYTDPKGSRVGFGALLVGYYEKNELKYAGKVGTGFDTEILKTLGRKLKKIEVNNLPIKAMQKAKGVHFVKPRLVGQFFFSEWTKDLKLRHPRYLGLREDKKAKDVIRESEKRVKI